MTDIRGADQLAKLAKQLKEAGDKGLQRELSKAISQATKPVKEAARQSALETLPKRGGLAARVAGSRFSTRRYASSRASGIRIQAKNAYALGRLDKGRVRHPVFADQGKTRDEWTWVTQIIWPGWWTKPTKAAAPAVRREIEQAMQTVANKIGRR
jgi:hypothetical protein